MPRHVSSDDDDEPLDDKTVAIPLHNKRTERLQRKKATRDKRRDAIINLAKLPTEIILEAVKCLRPSEVLNLALVNRRLHSIVHANANIIGDFIIKLRYPILAQCFPLPKRLSEVSPPIADLLRDPARQTNLSIHKKPYSHIQPPDAQVLCTCLTCILTWNNLGLALDFAHWQDNLDSGEPIPTLPRGKTLDWNEELVAQNANIVRKAVTESLWHARILEIHLDSTIRSIRRHALNKGNRRKHVEMTEEEAAEGTDHLLEKPGPLSLEFPFHRDNYYLLEAYLPNRWWKKFEQRWVYIIGGQHERDLEMMVRYANRRPVEKEQPTTSQPLHIKDLDITDLDNLKLDVEAMHPVNLNISRP